MATTPSIPVEVKGITNASAASVYKSTSAHRLDASAAGNYGQVYANQNATGDTRAWYVRLYAKIAAASGDALRAFATVENVAASTYRGLHASLNFADTGTVTGLGAAIEATLHINNSGSAAGTLTSVKAAINADGAASDPAGATSLSYIRVENQGNATGMADIDTDATVIAFSGLTGASGVTNTISTTSLTELPAGSIGFRITYNGNTYYVPAVIAAEWN
jgi:hypothetical protein